MSDKTEYHIIKPKIIKNGTNACWINAPLFASSAHEIIILQHFILDNSRLVQGELDITSIFIEKFLNVNRLDNLPWNEQTYLDIYYILSDIAHGNYFFDKKDPVPQYGYYGPGDIILQKFMGMITKNFSPITSELCYLKTETKVCRNKEEFNSLIENTDGNTKFELISFIASVCTDTINNLPQKPPTHMNTKLKKELAKKVLKPRDMSHWNAYVLKNNGKWRYFNALRERIKDIDYDEIFNCSDNKGMHVCCIYIDRKKFNKIMNLSEVFNTFKNFMKYFNESKSKSNIDITEFYKLSNDFIQEYYSMQNFSFSPIGMLDPNAGPGSKGFLGSQILPGSKGSQILPGSKGSQVLPGSKGSQVLPGSKGSQVLPGSKGSLVLPGSKGSRVLPGSKGSQVLPGSKGSQVLPGSKGSQVLPGSKGSQVLPGSKGSQLLPDPRSKSSEESVYHSANSYNSDVSHIITKSMEKEIDILIKKNINLLKIEDIRKILIKLKVKIPLETIDIRGLLINTILKIKK